MNDVAARIQEEVTKFIEVLTRHEGKTMRVVWNEPLSLHRVRYETRRFKEGGDEITNRFSPCRVSITSERVGKKAAPPQLWLHAGEGGKDLGRAVCRVPDLKARSLQHGLQEPAIGVVLIAHMGGKF